MSSPIVRTLGPVNWYERHVVVADLLITVVCVVVLGVTAAEVVGQEYPAPLVAIPLGMCLLLAIRRSRPAAFVAAMAVLAALQMLLIPRSAVIQADVLALVAVHTAARYCTIRFGYAALVTAVGGAIWGSLTWIRLDAREAEFDRLPAFLFATGAMIGAVVISYALGRAQRSRTKAIEEQVAALAERNRLMQLEHEQQLLLTTAEERGRLAAETHDILAHSLAIIVAQADGAAMLIAKDPTRAQQAIAQIGDTSREALAEVRQKVAALRRGSDPTADLAPAKSLADLPDLATGLSRAGVAVELQTTGDLGDVPAGASLSAYRIVQEALTNVLKHAGPRASAQVEVVRAPNELRLRIEDDGRDGAVPADGAGSGLRGMRARVEQYGGGLDVGPRVGGGFAVRAVLPLPPSRPERLP